MVIVRDLDVIVQDFEVFRMVALSNQEENEDSWEGWGICLKVAEEIVERIIKSTKASSI